LIGVIEPGLAQRWSRLGDAVHAILRSVPAVDLRGPAIIPSITLEKAADCRFDETRQISQPLLLGEFNLELGTTTR
jgi:hypothetical protein